MGCVLAQCIGGMVKNHNNFQQKCFPCLCCNLPIVVSVSDVTDEENYGAMEYLHFSECGQAFGFMTGASAALPLLIGPGQTCMILLIISQVLTPCAYKEICPRGNSCCVWGDVSVIPEVEGVPQMRNIQCAFFALAETFKMLFICGMGMPYYYAMLVSLGITMDIGTIILLSEFNNYVLFSRQNPTVVSEPVVSEPVVSEPVVSEPVVSEPDVLEPDVLEPVVSEPVVSEMAMQAPVVQEIVREESSEQKIVVQEIAEQEIAEKDSNNED